MIYAVMAAVFFGVADIFTKIGTVKLNTVRMTIINAIFSLPVAYIFFIYMNGSIPMSPILIKAIIIQGVSAIAFLFFFLALLSGPVSIIAPIVSGYSVVSIIGGMLFLKEMPTLIQFIAIIIIIIGSVTICLEPKSNKHGKGRMWIIWTLLATLLWGTWSIVSKTLVNEIEPVTMTLIFGIVAPFVWMPYILIWWKKEKNHNFNPLGILFGILSVIITTLGGIAFYRSLRELPVSIAAPIVGSHPIITVFLSLVFLKEKFYRFQYLSFFLIIIGLYLLK